MRLTSRRPRHRALRRHAHRTATPITRRPDSADRRDPQEHQGGRQGAARCVGGRRPFHARARRRHATRSRSSRSAPPAAIAGSGSASAHASRTAMSSRSSTTRSARRKRRPTSRRPGSPTSCASCTATRSRRFRSCRAPSTSCFSTPGSPTTSASSTWSIHAGCWRRLPGAQRDQQGVRDGALPRHHPEPPGLFTSIVSPGSEGNVGAHVATALTA